MAEFLTLDIDPPFAHELEYKLSRAKLDFEGANTDYFGEYSGTTPHYIEDTSGYGDKGAMIINPEFIQSLQPQRVTAAPIASPDFSSQNALGTAGYSQDMSGYLNNLSTKQLLGLGDFDIKGLARSDLSSMSPYVSGTNSLAYTPDQLATISKYRNVGTSGPLGTIMLQYDDPNPYNLNDANNAGQLTAPMWTTRNFDDTLYEYKGDGGFGLVSPNEYGHSGTGWVGPVAKTAMAVGAAALGGAAVGAAAGGAGAAGSGATAAGTGAGSGLGMGGAATGTAGGLGSSTSLISGAGSLNLGAGSGFAGAAGAGGAGLGSTAGLAYGGTLGSGVGAGLGASSSYGAGANALASSPSFSLIEGANSLNLGLADRYALPEDLQSLNMDTDYGDLAQRAKKITDMIFNGGTPQGQYAPQSGSQGFSGGSGGGGDYEAQNALGYTPYRLPARQNTLGYIDRLRSQ